MYQISPAASPSSPAPTPGSATTPPPSSPTRARTSCSPCATSTRARSRRPDQGRKPERRRHPSAARPVVARQRPQGRRRTARRPPAHRPADQQRGRDVRADAGDHQRRLRDAVRHQPPRPLRADGPAAGQHAVGRRVAGGHGQQRRAPHPGPHPFRRPAVVAQVQPHRGVRPVQARQPDVHLRPAATAASSRAPRPSRSPRILVSPTPS